MMPSADVDESERWTWTSGEDGLEVKINDGKRAICCSLWVVYAGRSSSSSDTAEGEGEGGKVMVDWVDAFPFALRSARAQLDGSPVRPQPEHHLPVDAIVSHPVSDLPLG